MATAGLELELKKEIPAFVRFERRPVEDVQASLNQGRYIAKDVDYVFITPPYSKDEIIKKAGQWLMDVEKNVREGRLSTDVADRYKRAYAAYKDGQELPLDGTPIRGWGILSPSQQEELIRMKVLTVEQLSRMNEEGCKHYGMGAVDLKNKATAWLAQQVDKGPLTMKMATMQKENEQLQVTVKTLHEKVAELTALVSAQQPGAIAPAFVEDQKKGARRATAKEE